MVPTSRLSPEQLRELADDAFVVMNWAKRKGMRRDRQIDETVKAFEVTLGYREAVSTAPASTGLSHMPLDAAPRVANGGRP